MLTFFNCKKDHPVILYQEATLSYQGDYSYDGCGYFFTINNHQYKADNESIIDNSFQNMGIKTQVLIQYKVLSSPIGYTCGLNPDLQKIDGIHLLSIKKK